MLGFDGGIFCFDVYSGFDYCVVCLSVKDLRSVGRKRDKEKKADFRIGGIKWNVRHVVSQW